MSWYEIIPLNLIIASWTQHESARGMYKLQRELLVEEEKMQKSTMTRQFFYILNS